MDEGETARPTTTSLRTACCTLGVKPRRRADGPPCTQSELRWASACIQWRLPPCGASGFDGLFRNRSVWMNGEVANEWVVRTLSLLSGSDLKNCATNTSMYGYPWSKGSRACAAHQVWRKSAF